MAALGLTLAGEARGADAPRSATPANRALAVTLLQQGKELMAAGNLAEACPKLEESYRVDADLGTLLNLALCHDQAGKIATAWTELTAAAAEARRTNQPDRASLAERRAAALEPRVARVFVRVGGAVPTPGVEVRVDGVLVALAALATPIGLEPGAHSVQVSAKAKLARAATFRVADGAKNELVDVAPLEDDPNAPIAAQPSPTAANPQATSVVYLPTSPRSTTATPTNAATASPMFALGVVAAVVGAVGVGAGTYFAMTAYSRRNDRSELCDASNACTSPEGVRADADARDASRLSTITMLSGAALVAVGVTLVVVAPRARARTATSLAVHPEVAPFSGRIVLGGNF